MVRTQRWWRRTCSWLCMLGLLPPGWLFLSGLTQQGFPLVSLLLLGSGIILGAFGIACWHCEQETACIQENWTPLLTCSQLSIPTTEGTGC